MSVDIEKRQFMSKAGSVAVATAAAGALAPMVYAKNVKHEVDCIMAWPANFPGFTPPVQRSADEIYKLTDGEIKFNVVGAGQEMANGNKVNPFKALELVSDGSAAMANVAAYYYMNVSPIMGLFTSMPYGMATDQFAGWWSSGAGKAFNAWLPTQGANVHAIRGMSTGLQAGGWFQKEINSVDDFKGLRYRIPGMGGSVMKRLGAETISLPGGKIPSALQNGDLDATEWVGPYLDSKMGFHKMAKYYYTDGFHEPGGTLMNFINLDFWNALTEKQRTIIHVCLVKYQFVVGTEALFNENITAYQMFKNEGVQFRQYPLAVRQALKKESEALFMETMQTNADTERFFRSFMEYKMLSGEYLRQFDDTLRCQVPAE